ncbi:MAG: ABC transporter substrate-binding protein [Candidatus Tectomicrobia bacterium]|nr:ABC transporter substrate-binding protein [Candidatus Tectomicrobia bacterium]
MESLLGRRIVLLLVWVFAVVTLTPHLAPALEMRIAVQPTPSAAPLYVAQRQGYFRDAGLTVRIVPGLTPELALEKVVAGNVDVAMTDYATLLQRIDKGAGLAILANLEIARDAIPDVLALQTPRANPVVSIKALEGKQVAIGAGEELARLALLELLRQNKADPKKVILQPVNVRELPFVFQRKEIAAVVAPEPYATMLKAEQEMLTLAYPYFELGQGIPLTGLAANRQWAERRPHSSDRLLRGLEEAVEWLQRDRGNAVSVLQEWLMLSDAVAPNMLLSRWSTRLSVERLQLIADALHRHELIKTPLKAASLLLRPERISQR